MILVTGSFSLYEIQEVPFSILIADFFCREYAHLKKNFLLHYVSGMMCLPLLSWSLDFSFPFNLLI